MPFPQWHRHRIGILTQLSLRSDWLNVKECTAGQLLPSFEVDNRTASRYLRPLQTTLTSVNTHLAMARNANPIYCHQHLHSQSMFSSSHQSLELIEHLDLQYPLDRHSRCPRLKRGCRYKQAPSCSTFPTIQGMYDVGNSVLDPTQASENSEW